LDIVFHVLVGVIFIGFYWDVLIGSVLPDTLYFIAGAVYGLDRDKARNSKIFAWGERFHSILIIPLLLLITAPITKNGPLFRMLLAGTLHIITDIITHSKKGPRFLWPIKDTYWPRGLAQWEEIKTFIVAYTILAIVYLFMRVILK